MIVRCIETGEVFNSYAEAEKATGINQTAIRHCCNGHTQTSGGFHWESEGEAKTRCKRSKPNICFDCKKATGKCSWSKNFTPVPGWTAEPVRTVHKDINRTSGIHIIETYYITACPLFERG